MGKKQCWEVLPQPFLQRLREIVPAERQDGVLSSFCQKRPTTFRANTLKLSADQLAEKLPGQGIAAQRVAWCPEAFMLEIPSGVTGDSVRRSLTETDLYKNGYLYVQSLSSMIPPILLNPRPGESVLDIAAAPGSKTTQIAAMMQNQGEIVANDKSHVRMYKLKANLQQQGVTNTQTLQLAGQSIWQKYQEYFDKSLVDVPCSMEGRFTVDDPKSYAEWSTKKIKELVQTQRFLLRSAVSATKPGGILVYSTCTLAPEENEGVVDWILEKENGALDVLPIEHVFPYGCPGLTQWREKTFRSSLSHTMRILPSVAMEGFYVAVLRKNKSTVSSRLDIFL